MIESLILDSNLLLLLVVGSASPDYISRHKRLRTYTPDDYYLLCEFIAVASRVFVTPNTLTETSNLLRGFGELAEPARSQIGECFRTFIQDSDERYLESSRGARREEFIRLGLTDSVLHDAAVSERTITLLTADFDLCMATLAHGGKAINFTAERAPFM